MKVLLNVTVEGIEDEINRQIIVSDCINLQDLCELIIICMNGRKIPIYNLECGKVIYYPLDIIESKYEKSLIKLSLKDLNLNKGKSFNIEYDFDNFYNFNVVVDNIFEKNMNNVDCEFEISSGKGYGIIDGETLGYLNALFAMKRKVYENYYTKREKEYLQKSFNIDEVNNRINEWKKQKEELSIPKRYIFNVSLEGFNKEIKRKISVNSDIIIDDFCRKVIVAMNGDLSHGYGIKFGKEHLSEYYSDIELFHLNLKEKQRLKIIYDQGDNWIFNLTVSKIINGCAENEFEVISGKGYGIIDDCGGSWGLSNIFSGKNNDWGKYDINNFDLEKCNENVRKFG